MKVAIVGAGFSGLVTAKVLRELGLAVVVYEKAADIGGVWNASRRYAGVRTQNDKGTYRFSDLEMPAHVPEWPSGAQVQEYLQDYAERFDLGRVLRLGQQVVAAEQVRDGTAWRVVSTDGSGRREEEVHDHLVVANGIFSEPLLPSFPGSAAFEEAGGRVLPAHAFTDVQQAQGRHVVVVGYGKSACDVAVAASDAAASTTVVARRLNWKMPRRVCGVVNYKYLMLTRFGEALFPFLGADRGPRLLHRAISVGRRAVLASLQAVVTRQEALGPAGLVPRGPFSDIARSTVSLTSDGFVAAVRRGRITVHRDAEVAELVTLEGRPHVRLTTGVTLPADLLLCGTGYRQEVPFLEPAVLAQVQDERGNFQLHQHVQPLRVPRLSFVGYNSSFFSPLSAEVAALWIGAYLLGELSLPDPAEAAPEIDARLAWMEGFTDGRHARGTNLIPFSMHNIDALLDDLALNIGPVRRARQWLLPVDPSDYRSLVPRLAARVQQEAARTDPAAG